MLILVYFFCLGSRKVNGMSNTLGYCVKKNEYLIATDT